jgi:LmbE family N-acetylglucosaminyl deacetylase
MNIPVTFSLLLAMNNTTTPILPPLEQPLPADTVSIRQALVKLSVVGTVLYVAAHPDDENTGLLAYLANDRLLRAVYVSMTRGEGGQNLIGAEQAPWLGLIRTHELLGARSIDGAEQWFGRQRDFGFSKSPIETLNIWGKDDALADVVWAIRRLQPDVVMTRFAPDGKDTHGHHTASAQLALEAFALAANPTAFPDQLKHVQPWQATRIVQNRGFWTPPKPEEITGMSRIDVNGFNAVLGRSYGELAAKSRSMHKSQGFGDAPEWGPDLEYFKLLAGSPMTTSPLDGIDTTWRRIKGGEKVRSLVQQLPAAFEAEKPWRLIPRLQAVEAALKQLPDGEWKARKLSEVSRIIVACAGLMVEARSIKPAIVPGSQLAVTLSALNRGGAKVTLKNVSFDQQPGNPTLATPLATGQLLRKSLEYAAPAITPLTVPPFLREPALEGRWSQSDVQSLGFPNERPALTVVFDFEVEGKPLSIERPVIFSATDPVMGERIHPVEVVPFATVKIAAPTLMFPSGDSKTLEVTVKATAGTAEGTLRLEVDNGWSVEPAEVPFSLVASAPQSTLRFQLKPDPKAAAKEGRAVLKLLAKDKAAAVAQQLYRIDYPHLPPLTALQPATVKLVRFDMAKPTQRIGYIQGAGDQVAEALSQVGHAVTVLSPQSLEQTKLQDFDVLIFGVRAFNVAPALEAEHARLMKFVEGGGVMVVQYNTNNRISTLDTPIGPYSFAISRDRVTEERATMTPSSAQHPLMRVPNVLTPADFEGWVQERGLYFAGTWDKRYETPFSLNDTGETPKQGAVLIGRHGKGVFVYTGLSFFRQLPAGVPGAFRLFENILSLRGNGQT